jgi:hypothetical protein
MLASRLASDCPAHVLYPCSHEAIPEHTTAHRAAAIARPAGAEAARTRIAHVGESPDTAMTACTRTTVS